MAIPSITTILGELAKAKKAVVSVVGVIALIATSGALSGTAKAIVDGALAVATALGVYNAKNAPSA